MSLLKTSIASKQMYENSIHSASDINHITMPAKQTRSNTSVVTSLLIPPMDASKVKEALGHCMSHARKHISDLLKTKPLDTPFQHEGLRGLMLHHPRRKIKDFLYFAKRSTPPYFKPCLTVTMQDRTVVTVSWINCLKSLYEKNDPTTNKKKWVVQAFREAISLSPKMIEARDKFGVGKCSECNKSAKLHIDHDVTPFAKLLDDFLDSKGLQLTKVTVNFTTKPHTLMSTSLAAQWQKYHDDNATLKGLCRSCNCSKGSGGYRHKVK